MTDIFPLYDFPWPFIADSYHYSANVEPAGVRRENASGGWGQHLIDVGDDYLDEIAEKRAILQRDRSRIGSLPHMRAACWEATDWMFHQAATEHPTRFSYTAAGMARTWRNLLTDETQRFVMGDERSLPCAPLEFAAWHLQEDIALLDQREDDLFVDAGVVTFASNWSLNFDLGMTFLEIHGPLPLDYANGAMPRALQFLRRMTAETPYRRTNWTSTIGHRLDLSLEEYANWGADRGSVDLSALGSTFHLRVEVQHLVRLPQSNAILFLIRTHLASLERIARVPGWADQLRSVLETAPAEMIAYKSLTALRAPVIDYLSDFSLPQPTERG